MNLKCSFSFFSYIYTNIIEQLFMNNFLMALKRQE